MPEKQAGRLPIGGQMGGALGSNLQFGGFQNPMGYTPSNFVSPTREKNQGDIAARQLFGGGLFSPNFLQNVGSALANAKLPPASELLPPSQLSTPNFDQVQFGPLIRTSRFDQPSTRQAAEPTPIVTEASVPQFPNIPVPLPTTPSAAAVGQNLVTQRTGAAAPIVMPEPTQNVADFEDRNRYEVKTPYGTMASSRAISQAGFDRNYATGIQGLEQPARYVMNDDGGFTRNQSRQEWQDANIARIYRNAPAMDQKRTDWVENTIKDRRANQEYYATPSGATITAPTNMFGQPIKSWQDTYAKASAENLKRLDIDAGENGVLSRGDITRKGRVARSSPMPSSPFERRPSSQQATLGGGFSGFGSGFGFGMGFQPYTPNLNFGNMDFDFSGLPSFTNI